MTWEELFEGLPEKVRQTDVTIAIEGLGGEYEFFNTAKLKFSNEKENDVLDDGHPYLELNTQY